MRVSPFAVVAAAGLVSKTTASTGGGALVAQTFFVPLNEKPLQDACFAVIHSDGANCPINTMISITASIDGTVIYYDHWENGGYDVDVTDPALRSSYPNTEVWGDGDSSNGCVPIKGRSGTSCTDAQDYIPAGTAIIVENEVPTQPRGTSIKYDGADRIQSSYPIAITRGAFPTKAGSLMAGAVEVYDTYEWGTKFIAPVGGDNTRVDTEAWELVVLYVQACEDNTTVTVNGADPVTIHAGESRAIHANQNDIIDSTKPTQVSMITGDVLSLYEMRWFSLIPWRQFSKSYLAPVGDTKGQTKMILYNPNTYDISVQCYFNKRKCDSPSIGDRRRSRRKLSECSNYDLQETSLTYSVGAKDWAFTWFIADGSAMRCTNNAGAENWGTFYAMSITDSEVYTYGSPTYGKNYGGRAFDWGHPVVPVNMLTDQVLIGLGFGCTNNNCTKSHHSHSTVWISPLTDARVYVDLNNDGTPDIQRDIDALKSFAFKDDDDDDMSGAIIYAKERGGSTPVPIAAAWGQNPALTEVTYWDQRESMDLGTVVLPFPGIRASKSVTLIGDNDNDGIISSGDTLEYTIRIANVGQVDIAEGLVTIVDDQLDPQLTYIEGTTVYYSNDRANSQAIPDSGTTLFPLDESGIASKYRLEKRGGFNDIVFQVNVKHRDRCTHDFLLNAGYATFSNKVSPFSVKVPLYIPPPQPSGAPTVTPTAGPTKYPTFTPIADPTASPTASPTDRPTAKPTGKPTHRPTVAPFNDPTSAPTVSPTIKPRYAPPGPYTEGLCPIPITRETLGITSDKRPVSHSLDHPSYEIPERATLSAEGVVVYQAIQEARMEKELKEREFNKGKRDHEVCETRVTQLRDRVQQMRNNGKSQDEINVVLDEVNLKVADCQRLETFKQRLETELEQKKQMAKQADEKAVKLKELSLKLIRLERERGDLKKKRDGAEKKRANAEDRETRFKSQGSGKKNDADKAAAERAKFKQERDDAQSELDSKEAEITMCKSQISELGP